MLFSTYTNAQNIDSKSIEPSLVKLIIDFGKSYEGIAYKYGSCSPKAGFDCSGFMYYIFKMGGITLPRSSNELFNEGKKIKLKNVRIGDFLFFNTGSSKNVNHVGIVSEIVDNQVKMLHVSTSQGVQEIDMISSEYWNKKFVGSKRILLK